MAYNAETVTGDKVRIVEKTSAGRPDQGLADLVLIGDDGTEYVTVNGDATLLIERELAEEPFEFEPTAEEASADESTAAETPADTAA